MSFAENRSVLDDKIDVIALAFVVWRYKYVVLAAAGICGLIAIVLALTAVPIYRAEAVLTEVHDESMSSAAGLLNQFSGLANLAGMNLQSSGHEQANRGLLRSRRLVSEFIERYGLLDQVLQDSQRRTLWFAVDKFRESVLTINEDTRRGTTSVVVDWTDPVVASQWANQFVALTNEYVRKRALEESSENIAYLNKQIETTNVLEIQRVMYSLIENETKRLMLASAREEYAFSVIDPAVPPEERSSPRRTFMAMVGGSVGVFVGLLCAFILDLVSRRKAVRSGQGGQASVSS